MLSLKAYRGLTRACVVAILTATAGCGSGRAGIEVEGSVTVDGEPLGQGSIIFVPAAGTAGPKAAGRVVDGRFSLTSREGPVAGKHKIEIFADTAAVMIMDEPEQYASTAPTARPVDSSGEKLVADSPLEVVIVDCGDNKFDFRVHRVK